MFVKMCSRPLSRLHRSPWELRPADARSLQQTLLLLYLQFSYRAVMSFLWSEGWALCSQPGGFSGLQKDLGTWQPSLCVCGWALGQHSWSSAGGGICCVSWATSYRSGQWQLSNGQQGEWITRWIWQLVSEELTWCRKAIGKPACSIVRSSFGLLVSRGISLGGLRSFLRPMDSLFLRQK